MDANRFSSLLILIAPQIVDLIVEKNGIDEEKATVSFIDADNGASSCCPPQVLMPTNNQSPIEYVNNLFDLIDISHTNFNIVLRR